MVEKLLCIADDKKLELTSIKNHSDLTALVVAERLHRKILRGISIPQKYDLVFKYWNKLDELQSIIELLKRYGKL